MSLLNDEFKSYLDFVKKSHKTTTLETNHSLNIEITTKMLSESIDVLSENIRNLLSDTGRSFVKILSERMIGNAYKVLIHFDDTSTPGKKGIASAWFDIKNAENGDHAKKILKGKYDRYNWAHKYPNMKIVRAVEQKKKIKESEEAPVEKNHISDYKPKHVNGLHNYDHYEHPDGTWVQVWTGKPVHYIYKNKNGEQKRYIDFKELKQAVNLDHKNVNIKESYSTFKDTIVAKMFEKASSTNKEKFLSNIFEKKFGESKTKKMIQKLVNMGLFENGPSKNLMLVSLALAINENQPANNRPWSVFYYNERTGEAKRYQNSEDMSRASAESAASGIKKKKDGEWVVKALPVPPSKIKESNDQLTGADSSSFDDVLKKHHYRNNGDNFWHHSGGDYVELNDDALHHSYSKTKGYHERKRLFTPSLLDQFLQGRHDTWRFGSRNTAVNESTSVFVDPNDQSVSRIIRAAFPGYNGKKCEIKVGENVYVDNQWSSGSRTSTVFVELETLKVFNPPAMGDTGFVRGSENIPLPPNVAGVQHVMFQGKDLGIRIIVRPENSAPLLPNQVDELSMAEKIVLIATRSLKSSYGGRTRAQMAQDETGIPLPTYEKAKTDLIAKGYLMANGALTLKGKNSAGSDQLWKYKWNAGNLLADE